MIISREYYFSSDADASRFASRFSGEVPVFENRVVIQASKEVHDCIEKAQERPSSVEKFFCWNTLSERVG